MTMEAMILRIIYRIVKPGKIFCSNLEIAHTASFIMTGT